LKRAEATIRDRRAHRCAAWVDQPPTSRKTGEVRSAHAAIAARSPSDMCRTVTAAAATRVHTTSLLKLHVPAVGAVARVGEHHPIVRGAISDTYASASRRLEGFPRSDEDAATCYVQRGAAWCSVFHCSRCPCDMPRDHGAETSSDVVESAGSIRQRVSSVARATGACRTLRVIK
jgi:hypothetical protein